MITMKYNFAQNEQEPIKNIYATCPHDCPDSCSMIIKVKDKKAISVEGNPDHPMTRGFLCAKVSKYLERTYHKDRLLYPMKRIGKKGNGEFTRITWDEAFDEIIYNFKESIQKYGSESILPYSYAGTMGLLQSSSMDRRFFHKIGASLLDRTICSTAGMKGYQYTIGNNRFGMNPEDLAYSKLIILWGTNTLTSNPHIWPFIKKAKQNGAYVISIDPWKNKTAHQVDQHIFIRPGTDSALALGLMNFIFANQLEDFEYIEKYCLGYDLLKKHVLDNYNLTTVSNITGISVQTIEDLALKYATARTSAIRLNYGLQRNFGGGMAVRTITCLPAIIGAWKYVGGGTFLSTSGAFPINYSKLELPSLIPKKTRTINMNQLGLALTELRDPEISSLFVYNSNPAEVAPDLEIVKKGLLRENLFTVVHEHFITETAKYADILIPATTQLEHIDLHRSYGTFYLQYNNPAIDAIGESKSNVDVFTILAQKMGFEETCFSDTIDDLLNQALDTDSSYLSNITIDSLKQNGWATLNIPNPFLPFIEGNFDTPSKKCEFYSEQMLKDGYSPLPTWTSPMENAFSNSNLSKLYPLALITPAAHHFLNSTFSNVLDRYEKTPIIFIHPINAKERNISDYSKVRVENARGFFELTAKISDDVLEGVLISQGLWWSSSMPKNKGVNCTTSSQLSDMGGGATFYDNLVEVKAI